MADNILSSFSGDTGGEYITLPDDPSEIRIEPTADGGLIQTLPDNEENLDPQDQEFYSNLALAIPETELDRLATDLLRKIEADKEDRKKRDEQYEEGIKRTGLGKDAPGGAEFEGASKVVHPMMEKACIDYQSRVIKELWPPGGKGVAKPRIMGTVTQDKTDRADRIVAHINYQLTDQIKEAKAVLESLLSQVPLGGSQYIRQVWDHRLKRPTWTFAPIDDVYLPFSAASYASATRRTYRQEITEIELKNRIESGMYREIPLVSPSQAPDPSRSEKANRKIEGKDDPSLNLDGVREIYETMEHIEVSVEMADALNLEKEGEIYPYLFSIDVTTKKVLAIYRDWEQNDETRDPIEHLFEFALIPWRGAYAIGLPHIIGGLSASATGAIRALLDSAHTNNTISGFVRKGSGISGQTRKPAIGELIELDVPLETSDIRQALMLGTFNPPSPVLFQLLGALSELADGVVRTSLDETPSDGATNVPVGTQMSRVEQGLTVFCACFGRAHDSLDRLLKGLYRLNRLYLPDEVRIDAEGGELVVRRKDYDGSPCIRPVSNPTIYSDQQRFIQITAVQQRADSHPQLYDAWEVEKAFLDAMKVPENERFLLPRQSPQELNAVAENVAMAMGKPVEVFPEQDHMAHIKTVLDFMQSPLLGMNQMIAPTYLPAALKHVMQHVVYFYAEHSEDVIIATANMSVSELVSSNEQVKRALDQLIAEAGAAALTDVERLVGAAQPILQQAMQMLQQITPKPPMDPTLAAIQTAQMETQRKSQADQASHQLETAKAQTAAQQEDQRIQMDKDGLLQQGQAKQIDAQTKIATTTADNQTAIQIARMKHGAGNFSNGESM